MSSFHDVVFQLLLKQPFLFQVHRDFLALLRPWQLLLVAFPAHHRMHKPIKIISSNNPALNFPNSNICPSLAYHFRQNSCRAPRTVPSFVQFLVQHMQTTRMPIRPELSFRCSFSLVLYVPLRHFAGLVRSPLYNSGDCEKNPGLITCQDS